jgi:hypothetical protein
MDADDLLTGPRGRRLCLEWALRLSADAPGDDELGSAVMLTSHDMDQPGVSWVVAWKDGAEDHDLPGPSTPAEVAALIDTLIDTVPLRAPGDRELLRLLDIAASSAMYWQPPSGEDVLAATPEVAASLRRVARSVLDSPLTDWWESPVDLVCQWSVERVMPDDRPPEPPPAPAAQLLERFGHEISEERLAYQGSDDDVHGNWWSIPPIGLTRSTRYLDDAGPFGLWCEEDGMGFEQSTARRIVPPESPHVLEITGPEDWAGLCAAFPLDVTACRRTIWREATGRDGLWLIPDWPAVAASGVDGVHLTTAGYLRTAGRAVDVVDAHSSVLAGWAPDITIWLTDVETTGEPVSWQMDADPELDYRILS